MEDIEATPGCLAAHKLHEACAWGSSGDGLMSEAVIDKCKAAFFNQLTRKQRRLYEKRLEACGERYPVTQDGGSIQIYLSSMCAEDLAAAYFKVARHGRITATPRWKVPDIAE